VAGINADNWQALGPQTMIEPGGELASFETDTIGALGVLLHHFGDGIWRRNDAAAPHYLVVLIDDRDRGHVEADMLLQASGHGTRCSGWRLTRRHHSRLAITPCSTW
jgi:hypothetical protein